MVPAKLNPNYRKKLIKGKLDHMIKEQSAANKKNYLDRLLLWSFMKTWDMLTRIHRANLELRDHNGRR